MAHACCLWLALGAMLGCAAEPIPDISWRIVIGDRTGQMSIITATSKDILGLSPRLEMTRISGTLSHCTTGWYDPLSNDIATLERGESWNESWNEKVVRIYGPKMLLKGEYRSEGSNWHSCPSILPGGHMVAMVDLNSDLVIGVATGESFVWRTICKLPEVRPNAYLEWLGAERIAVGGNASIYLVNVGNASYSEIGRSTLLGTVDGMMVSAADGDVVVLGSDGEVVRHLGYRVLPEYGGAWVDRISPDGQFVAYEAPSSLLGTALVFEHLGSGRRAYIRGLRTPVRMGSWQINKHAESQPLGAPR